MFDSGMLILSLAIWFCRFFLKNFDNFQGPAFNPPEKFCWMTPQNFGRQKFLWWNWEKFLNKAEFVNIYKMSYLISGILSTFTGLNLRYSQNERIKVWLQSLKFYWFEAYLLSWSEPFLSNLMKKFFVKNDLSFRTVIF